MISLDAQVDTLMISIPRTSEATWSARFYADDAYTMLVRCHSSLRSLT